MRTKIFTLIICLILFWGCKNEQPGSNQTFNPNNITIIEGKIENLKTYPHIKELSLHLPTYSNQSIKVPIDTSGHFRFDFFPKTTTEIQITSIEDIIIVSPGDSIFIKKDFKWINRTKFSGDKVNLNANISRFKNFYFIARNENTNLSANVYVDNCKALKEENYARLEKLKSKYGITDEFEKWATNFIESYYCKSILKYKIDCLSRRQTNPLGYFGNMFFMNNLERSVDPSVFKADYLLISHMMLEYYWRLEKMKNPGKFISSNDIDPAFLLNFYKSTKNKYLGQILVYRLLNTPSVFNQAKNIEKYKDFIDNNITDPFLYHLIQDQYNRVKVYNHQHE